MKIKKNFLVWTQGLHTVFLGHYLRFLVPFVLITAISELSLILLSYRHHQIASFFVGAVLWPYYILYCVQILRNKHRSVLHNGSKELIKIFYLLVTAVLVSLIITLGVVALIIPGVVWTVYCSMCLLSVVDKNLSPIKAIKYSVNITKPFFTEILIFCLYAILSAILLQGYFRISLISESSISVLYGILYCVWIFVIGPFNLLLYASIYKNISEVSCPLQKPSDSQEKPGTVGLFQQPHYPKF